MPRGRRPANCVGAAWVLFPAASLFEPASLRARRLKLRFSGQLTLSGGFAGRTSLAATFLRSRPVGQPMSLASCFCRGIFARTHLICWCPNPNLWRAPRTHVTYTPEPSAFGPKPSLDGISRRTGAAHPPAQHGGVVLFSFASCARVESCEEENRCVSSAGLQPRLYPSASMPRRSATRSSSGRNLLPV